jgi:DNA-directed RNA polymerase specialized sigma24 family protein/LysM repeat protein
MFDRDPELSPDLVWLLQSQQVEDGLLARLLVQETYAQLQTFWEAMLDDPQAARLASQETLISALVKANTFHEPQSVRAWLIGLAVNLYRKDRRKLAQGYGSTPPKVLHLDRLTPATRLAAVLHFRLNYPPEEIAGFLGEKLPTPETRLSVARQLLLDQVNQGGYAGVNRAEGDPLALAFQRAYPTSVLSEADLESISQEVIERARRKRRGIQRVAYWKEIAMIGAVILVVLLWMTRANLDTPEAAPKPPAEKALAGGRARPTSQLSATPSANSTSTPYTWINTTGTPYPWTKTIRPTPTPIPENAFYTVQEGDTLTGIAIQLGTSLEALRSLNRLPEGAVLQPGQILLKPGSLHLNTPVPNPWPTRLAPSPTQLSSPLTSDEILGRLNNFYFNSFWVDLQFIYRGPQGYLGDARAFRMQLWQTPSGALILAGQSHDTPDQAIKWWRWSANEFYVAQPKFGSPWFKRSDPAAAIGPLFDPLNLVFNLHADYLKDQWVNTQVVGSGQVGDRPVFILKQFNSQQQLLRTIWMDKASSLPLHIQMYDPRHPQHITFEMVVTGLEINPTIPDKLFNPQIPWLGGYAKDSSGAPVAMNEDPSPWEITPSPRFNWPYTLAPVDLNLSTSPLQFQFGQLSPLFPSPNSQVHYRVEIFTGNQHLGLATLPDPFLTLCARSPDGGRIAYSSASISNLDIFYGQATPTSPIRWIDLNAPDRENFTDLQPFSFVFSPDNQQLAVFGDRQYANRGIYLADLQSAEVRLLQRVDHASSLVWKPDGKRLAYINRSTGSQPRFSLVVLDVESGEVVSRQSFPAPADPPAQNVQAWPPLQWGVSFPVGMGDLGACAAPPRGK